MPGWAGERGHVGGGAERQLLNTLLLRLANSLAWQKLLENEMWVPVPKMGRGGVAEMDMVFAWNNHAPCGMGAPQGKEEAGAGKLGEVCEHCGRRSPEEEPAGCLHTDFEALEGRKLAPKKREKGKNTDFGDQKPRV